MNRSVTMASSSHLILLAIIIAVCSQPSAALPAAVAGTKRFCARMDTVLFDGHVSTGDKLGHDSHQSTAWGSISSCSGIWWFPEKIVQLKAVWDFDIDRCVECLGAIWGCTHYVVHAPGYVCVVHVHYVIRPMTFIHSVLNFTNSLKRPTLRKKTARSTRHCHPLSDCKDDGDGRVSLTGRTGGPTWRLQRYGPSGRLV